MTTPAAQLAQVAFKKDLEKVMLDLQAMLIDKNARYGDSALNPVQVFSRSTALELIRVRIDDKLARIRNGDTSEDAGWDLMGYLVLERIEMNRIAKLAETAPALGIRNAIVDSIKHLDTPAPATGPIPDWFPEAPRGPAPSVPLHPNNTKPAAERQSLPPGKPLPYDPSNPLGPHLGVTFGSQE